MEFSLQFIISIFLAVISSAVQIVVLVVLYRTLKEMQHQNTHHEQSLDIQRTTQKYNLTFTFADWVSSEVKYYSPLYENNQGRKYILTHNEINIHLVALGEKMISLCNEKIVDKSILKDEIERLVATLQNMESKPTSVIIDLEKLLRR